MPHELKLTVLLFCLSATMLAACRRQEVQPIYQPQPMKLGTPVKMR